MKDEHIEELARAMAPNFNPALSKAVARALAPIIDRLVSEAREEERAAVVAYLRASAEELKAFHSVVPGFLLGAADDIETGVYRG